jgi:hypothetical protein
MAEDRGRAVLPPPDLHARSFPVGTGVASDVWSRVHRIEHGPCFFSRSTGNRFSSAGLGVIYLAQQDVTAFWEVFWDDLATRPREQRRIAKKKLDERAVCRATLRRQPRLFDATDAETLLDVSAPAGTFYGDYDICQAWAVALAGHSLGIDGIRYRSARSASGICVALFEGKFKCADIDFDASAPLGSNRVLLEEVEKSGVRLLIE